MPRRPAAYPPAYREQVIALARAGRTSNALAKAFEPSAPTIGLRRENQQWKVERDILGNAAAWFVRESGTIPPDASAS